jgi:hypothetical protein
MWTLGIVASPTRELAERFSNFAPHYQQTDIIGALVLAGQIFSDQTRKGT